MVASRPHTKIQVKNEQMNGAAATKGLPWPSHTKLPFGGSFPYKLEGINDSCGSHEDKLSLSSFVM